MSSDRYQPATVDGLAVSTWCNPKRAPGYPTNLASGSGTAAAFNTDHEKGWQPIRRDRLSSNCGRLKRSQAYSSERMQHNLYWRCRQVDAVSEMDYSTVRTFPQRWAYVIARCYWDQPDD